MEHSEAGLPRIDWQSQASTHTEKKFPPVDQGEPDRPASSTPYSQSFSVTTAPDRSGRRVGGRSLLRHAVPRQTSSRRCALKGPKDAYVCCCILDTPCCDILGLVRPTRPRSPGRVAANSPAEENTCHWSCDGRLQHGCSDRAGHASLRGGTVGLEDRGFHRSCGDDVVHAPPRSAHGAFARLAGVQSRFVDLGGPRSADHSE